MWSFAWKEALSQLYKKTEILALGSWISEKKNPKSGIVRSPKPVFKSTIYFLN